MFKNDGVTFEFHHLGIPTTEVRSGERFSTAFGMYTSDAECELLRVQWHRYAADSPIDPRVRSLPHPAFKVDSLDRAIAGRKLLLGPYEPIDGYRVAIIDDAGIPVELIQTELSDEEIWGRARTGKQTSIYAAPAPPAAD